MSIGIYNRNTVKNATKIFTEISDDILSNTAFATVCAVSVIRCYISFSQKSSQSLLEK